MGDRPKLVRSSGAAFFEWLVAAGIVGPDDAVRRVVIDAHVASTVTIYVERVGDERMLQVTPPDLSQATIEWADAS